MRGLGGLKKDEIATQAPKMGTKQRTGLNTAKSVYGWVSMTLSNKAADCGEKCLGEIDCEWLFV